MATRQEEKQQDSAMAGTDENVQHDISDSDSVPPVKHSKLADDSVEEVEIEDLKDLSKFIPDRILSCDSRSKTIIALGTFTDSSPPDDRAIIILEKKPFDDERFEKYCSTQTAFQKVFRNDVYGNYECLMDSSLNGVKATIIHPASDKHIEKYESKLIYVVEETPELYNSLTLPYLEKEQLNLQWVYNILDHKKEVDRIVLEDSDPSLGFVLLPDLKWDGKDIKSLYLLAIVRQTGIKSLRDLTEEHLPLLRNIQAKSINIILERYGLPSNRIRAFLHYQPTFYHLHVHFTYLQYDAPGIHAERAHMLTSVINNIELAPDFYKRATLPFVVRQADKLFSVLKDKNIVDV